MRRSERGANLVEMAIVLPLLVLLLAAAVDFGRAYQTYNVITNAAREGARTGARFSCYNNNPTQRSAYRNTIIQATINAAAGNGFTITSGNITIFPDPTSRCATSAEALTVTVRFQVATILGGILGRNQIDLTTSAAMSKVANVTPTPPP